MPEKWYQVSTIGGAVGGAGRSQCSNQPHIVKIVFQEEGFKGLTEKECHRAVAELHSCGGFSQQCASRREVAFGGISVSLCSDSAARGPVQDEVEVAP